MKFKKGNTATMLFHGFGYISEQKCKVAVAHKDGTVTLKNSYRFNIETRKCLNDNTEFGCFRTLKIK